MSNGSLPNAMSLKSSARMNLILVGLSNPTYYCWHIDLIVIILSY